MANIKLKQLFDGVANAIREKDNTVEEIIAKDFPDRIRAIPTTGGDAKLQRKDIEVKEVNQLVKPDVGFDGMTQVKITSINKSIDSNIKPENIISGTTILGVEGTAKPYKKPTLQTKDVNPSTQIQTVTFDNGYDGLSSVSVQGVNSSIDGNIVAENIRDGVKILDVTGNMKAGAVANLQYKEAEIIRRGQLINADPGFDGMKQLKVASISNEVDENIKAENIRNGITILGVTGSVIPNTAEGGIFFPTEDELLSSQGKEGDMGFVYTKDIPNKKESLTPMSCVKKLFLPQRIDFYYTPENFTISYGNTSEGFLAEVKTIETTPSENGEKQYLQCLDITCSYGTDKSEAIKYYSGSIKESEKKEGKWLTLSADSITEMGEPRTFPVEVTYQNFVFFDTTKSFAGVSSATNWFHAFQSIECYKKIGIQKAYTYTKGHWELEPSISDRTLTSCVVYPSARIKYLDSAFEHELDPELRPEGYAHVEILPVDSSVDENIIPENIRKGVSILGIEGQFDPTGHGFLEAPFNPDDACHNKPVDMTFAQMEPFHAYNGWKCPEKITYIPMQSNAYTDDTHHIGVPLIQCSNVTKANESVGATEELIGMFENCVDIPYLPDLRFENIENMDRMFKNCKKLRTAEPLMKGDLDKVLSMNSTFEGCESLIGLPAIDISNVTSMDHTFYGCSSLLTIPQLWGMEAIANSKVISMVGIFEKCKNLTFIPQYFDTASAHDMKLAFSECTNLQEVNVIKTSNATNMILMFNKCPNLSDTALNNILRMCINAVNIPEEVEGKRTKCLYFDETNIETGSAGIGLSREQIERCKNLPNWNDFKKAGWTAGI